jgi:hypothetical protein
MIKVIDNDFQFGIGNSNRKDDTTVHFDGMLGILPAGARVFVCVGPGPDEAGNFDSVYFDFAFAQGPVPALTPGGTVLACDCVLLTVSDFVCVGCIFGGAHSHLQPHTSWVAASFIWLRGMYPPSHFVGTLV